MKIGLAQKIMLPSFGDQTLARPFLQKKACAIPLFFPAVNVVFEALFFELL
jgi:hypothetical protein